MKVEIVDRSTMITALNKKLKIVPSRTAIVTVDMHRGHLDPSVATMPASPEDSRRVIAYTRELLTFGRNSHIPVIHVILIHRDISGLGSEAGVVPFWKALQELPDPTDRQTAGRKSTTLKHNLEGSPGTQIIPELLSPSDYIINNKKRLDCFYGTDLEILLRTLGVETVALTGVNTNTCVLNTAFSAFNRDFQVVVLSDCVASMFGEDLHILGLQNIQRCMGYVLTVEEFKGKVNEGR